MTWTLHRTKIGLHTYEILTYILTNNTDKCDITQPLVVLQIRCAQVERTTCKK